MIKLKDLIKEDLDPYKDFGTKNSWEKNYDLNLGAFVDEYQKFIKAVKKLKPIKDESKRAWANAIREKVGQGMFNGYIGMWMKPIEVLEENQKFEKLKDKDGWTYNESINENLYGTQKGHISDHHPAKAFGSKSIITEGAADKQLRHLKALLKRTGATLEVKGSTITIDLRTGGVDGAMEFQYPTIVKDPYEGKSVKEVASPLVNTLTHAISDVDDLIDAVYSDEADDAFKDPKLSKKLLMAVEKLLKKVR